MDRTEVVSEDRGKLERLFEGLTVEGLPVWFNVVHDSVEEDSPVVSVGGEYGVKGGHRDQILIRRCGDAWLNLADPEGATGNVPDVSTVWGGGGIGDEAGSDSEMVVLSWEVVLPWVVADGMWREVKRRVVLALKGRARRAGVSG
jgi:hypothetical protein